VEAAVGPVGHSDLEMIWLGHVIDTISESALVNESLEDSQSVAQK